MVISCEVVNELLTDPTPSAWKIILDYVANMKTDETVSRKTLMSLFDKYCTSYTTVDTYIWQFKAVNVLKTVKPGLYIKSRDIRNDWSLSEFKKITEGKTWRCWFTKLD